MPSEMNDICRCLLLTRKKGNYHAAIVCPKTQEDAARKILLRIQRRGIELEGTVTGEHRARWELGKSRMLIQVHFQIKLALDPQCILNCDKVFRMERS